MALNASLTAPGADARTCDTTGLRVCHVAQQFIKLNAVSAVVFLLIGGLAAILLALEPLVPNRRATKEKAT